MPTGPNGEKRPADVIGCAVTVMRIAAGEEQDTVNNEVGKRNSKHPGKSNSGKAGGTARAKALTAEQRKAIARQGAAARWSE